MKAGPLKRPAFFFIRFGCINLQEIKLIPKKTSQDMLLEIFSAPIASGAQLFWTIVSILVGLGAGLSAIDFRSTQFKKKEE